MRIISGQLGGRTFRVPSAGVRPTQDRVREAIFSSLGQLVDGTRVLDLFAGSGAMGIEAWSRGAAQVCWVENSRSVFNILRANVEQLCGREYVPFCICKDTWPFLKNISSNQKNYDIVFADPPYQKKGGDQLCRMLDILGSSPVLIPGGMLVYEMSAKEEVISHSVWELLRNKRYGGCRVVVYRKIEE